MPISRSFTRIVDFGMRDLLFYKFSNDLQLVNQELDVAHQPFEVAPRFIAEGRGENSVGFINFWHSNDRFSWSRHRTPLAREGLSLDFTDSSEERSEIVKTVPVDLSYSVHLWSLSLDRLLDAQQTFLFWVHENPNIDLLVNDKYPLPLDLVLEPDIIDKSTVDERYDRGVIYIKEFNFKVESWDFKFSQDNTVLSIRLRIYDNLNDPQNPILLTERIIT